MTSDEHSGTCLSLPLALFCRVEETAQRAAETLAQEVPGLYSIVQMPSLGMQCLKMQCLSSASMNAMQGPAGLGRYLGVHDWSEKNGKGGKVGLG